MSIWLFLLYSQYHSLHSICISKSTPAPSTTVNIDINFNAYYDCDKMNPPYKIYNSKCVKEYPLDTATYEGQLNCINLKLSGEVLYKGFVIQKCPDGYAPNSSFECKNL